MSSPLGNFKVLIADRDQELATVSKHLLKGMGFSKIQITDSGAKALALFKLHGFDFLITDWALEDMDGLSLIHHIRRDPNSPNPTIPVMMLTGRMEVSDVQTARDHGIHEYVIKPFSAQTIYNHLERIVEFPRCFVMGKTFVGPDRRNKQVAPPTGERRSESARAQRKAWDKSAATANFEETMVWQPDMSMKQKLGHNVSLASVITPAMLTRAQASIDAMAEDSLRWIKDDLAALKTLCNKLSDGLKPNAIMQEMNELTLKISTRSGTFGYKRAAEVAYMLYLFCRKQLHPKNAGHFVVIEKHIAVLQLIFGANIRDESAEIALVINELRNLTVKYAA